MRLMEARRFMVVHMGKVDCRGRGQAGLVGNQQLLLWTLRDENLI